jgi:hypothetical protein
MRWLGWCFGVGRRWLVCVSCVCAHRDRLLVLVLVAGAGCCAFVCVCVCVCVRVCDCVCMMCHTLRLEAALSSAPTSSNSSTRKSSTTRRTAGLNTVVWLLLDARNAQGHEQLHEERPQGSATNTAHRTQTQYAVNIVNSTQPNLTPQNGCGSGTKNRDGSSCRLLTARAMTGPCCSHT